MADELEARVARLEAEVKELRALIAKLAAWETGEPVGADANG